jgi:hypothetical protein
MRLRKPMQQTGSLDRRFDRSSSHFAFSPEFRTALLREKALQDIESQSPAAIAAAINGLSPDDRSLFLSAMPPAMRTIIQGQSAAAGAGDIPSRERGQALHVLNALMWVETGTIDDILRALNPLSAASSRLLSASMPDGMRQMLACRSHFGQPDDPAALNLDAGDRQLTRQTFIALGQIAGGTADDIRRALEALPDEIGGTLWLIMPARMSDAIMSHTRSDAPAGPCELINVDRWTTLTHVTLAKPPLASVAGSGWRQGDRPDPACQFGDVTRSWLPEPRDDRHGSWAAGPDPYGAGPPQEVAATNETIFPWADQDAQLDGVARPDWWAEPAPPFPNLNDNQPASRCEVLSKLR